MKWLMLAFSLFVIAPAMAQSAPHAGPGPSTAMTPTPDDRARQWLTLLDDGNYADAYKQMAASARAKISAQAWAAKVSAQRAPLGAMSSRALKDIKLSKTLPAMTAGQYTAVRYDSVFAHKAAAVETVNLVSEKGAWSAVSYSVE